MANKRGILATTLAVLFLLAAAVPLRASADDEKCERRVHKAEQNLEKAVRKHGEYSQQAEQRRRELEEARERCRHDHDSDRDHDRR